MPATYDQLKRGFDAANAAGGNHADLPAYVNYLAGGDQNLLNEYAAGLDDGILKRANSYLNTGIEATGLPALGESIGSTIGSWLGSEETGARAGRSLARGTLNLVPMFLSGGYSLPVQAAGALGAGGLAALDSYGQGASGGSALTTGALTAALPVFAGLGTKAGLALTGAPKVAGIATAESEALGLGAVGSTVAKRVPETLTQRIGGYLGGQAAGLIPFGTMEHIEAKNAGIDSPVGSKEWWIGTLIGQLPFTASDVHSVVAKGPSAKQIQATLVDKPNNVVPPPVIPSVKPVTPEIQSEVNELLGIQQQKAAVVNDASLTPEQRQAQTDLLNILESDALKKKESGVVPQTQLGTPALPKVDAVTLVGKVVHETQPNGQPGHQGSYFVEVQTANKLGFVGKTILVPKKMATINPDGSITVPTRFAPEATSGELVRETNPTPELIVQETPGEIKPGPESSVLGKRDELPIQENPGDIEAKLVANTAQQNEAAILETLIPTEIARDLETTKAQIVAVDKLNDQLDNGVPAISDVQLAKEITEHVNKGENLGDASTVVVEANKAKALEKVQTQQEKLSRQQRKLLRQVEVATEFGAIEEHVRENKANLEKADADPGALPVDRLTETDELNIINNAIEAHGSKMGGRMLDFVDELKAAYVGWVKKGRPTGEGKNTNAALGKIVKTVLARMETGKVITGGKVLRNNGEWSEKAKKGETKLFNTKEEADAAALMAQELEGIQNPKAMIRQTAEGPKYYVMERPREGKVEFDPTLAQPETAMVGEKVVQLPKAPTETKNELPITPEVRQAYADGALALTKEDVRNAVAEIGEVVSDDYVDKAAQRLAVLNEAQASGKLPTNGLKKFNTKAGEDFQTLLKSKGLEFVNTDEAIDFAVGDIVDILRRQVGEQLKAPSSEVSNALPTELAPADLFRLQQMQVTNPVKFLEGMIARETNPKAFSSGIAKVLLDHVDLLNDLKVEIIPGSNRASYNEVNKTIKIGAGFLASVPDINHVMPHEIAHGLSLKLIHENPEHPAVKEIDRLRELAVAELPAEIKPLYDRWIKENLMDKWAEGQDVDFGINRDSPWYHVLYGLANSKEFVAQAFSSSEFQGFLHTIKAPQKRSILQWLTDAIASLFGSKRAKDFSTLLHQSIVGSNRIFDAQRSMIHHEKIAQSLLLKNGLAPQNSRRRIMGLRDLLDSTPAGDTDFQASTYVDWITDGYNQDRASKNLTPLENQAVELGKQQWEALPEDVRLDQQELLKEVEVQAGVGDITESFTKVAGLENLPEEFWANLNPASIRMLEGFARYGELQTEILKAQERAAQNGEVNVRPAHNMEALDKAQSRFKTIMTQVRKAQKDQADVLSMSALSSDGFIDKVFNGEAAFAGVEAGDLIGEIIGKPEKGKEIGSFARAVQPLWQIAMEHPEMKPAVGALFDHRGEIEQNRNRVFSHFSMEPNSDGTASWSEKAQQTTEKFLARPDLVRRVDDILRLRQDKQDFLTSADPRDKAALDAVLIGLTPKDRNEVLTIADQQARSTMEGQELTVETNAKLETNLLAQIIQKGEGWSVSQSRKWANALMDGLAQLQDPNTTLQAQEQIATVRAQMTPEKFLSAFNFAREALTRVDDLRKFFEGRQWFATEQSFDKYHITARGKDGKLIRGFGDTLDAARKMVQKIDPQARVLKTVNKEDKTDPNRTYGAPVELIQKLEAQEKSMVQSLLAQGFDPSIIAQVQENSGSTILRKELAASQLYKAGSERQGLAGREYLPILANHFNYHTALIRMLQNRVTRSEVALATMNPDIASSPEKVGIVNQALNNFLVPDSPFASNLARGISTYNLAYSTANMIIEGMQGLTTHATELTAQGAGIIGGLSRLGKAAKDIIAWSKTGKWKNKEHEEVMRRFVQDLEVGYGAWDDSVTSSERVLDRAKDMQNAQKPKSLGDYVKSGVSAYGRLGMNLYGIMTHFNARLAGLSSFDLYRSQGLSFEEAYQKAREFNRTVNFSGGKAARPVGLFSNTGGWRAASQLMYIFRGFTLGMWSTLKRHISGGFSSNSKLTLAERQNSRKAATQMLATMFVMAGSLGLPGVEAVLTAAEDLTDLKLKQNLREGVASVLGDSTLAEGFLMGVPNMLGVDAHSRVSLGGFPGLSSFEGFSLKDLAGPAVGLAERFYTGAKKTLTGQTSEAASYLLPPGFRRLAEVTSKDSIDSSGGKFLGRLTNGEKVAMAIGFTPTRVAQMKEAERINYRSQKIDGAEKQKVSQAIAADILEGDTTAAQHKLKLSALQGQNDVKDVARSVAKEVENRTFPSELLDKPGSNQVGLANAFGISGHVSEIQRLQLRQQVMAKLGLPVTISPRDVQKAQMVDATLAQNPRMSRQQARDLVERSVPASF